MSSVNFNGIYVLMKGEPGTRKSTCALSFPGPQYWFSFDKKMDGLKLPMRAWNIDPKTIQFDDYSDWNPALVKLNQLVSNPMGYKTIIIDSITSCADAINRQTLRVKTGTKTKDGQDTGKMVAGIPINSIEDYAAEESALKELVSLTKDIVKLHKINVILVAHVIQKEMKSLSGQTHISRSIVTAGKGIAAKIPAYCSEVYHFNIEGGGLTGDGRYTLLTKHTGDDFARSSLDLPKSINFGDEPLYDKWIKPAIDGFNSAPENQSSITEPNKTTNKFQTT